MSLKLSGWLGWATGSKGQSDYWGVKFIDDLASELVKLSVKNGITYMDTAEDYAGGDSEKQLRVALSGLSAVNEKML